MQLCQYAFGISSYIFSKFISLRLKSSLLHIKNVGIGKKLPITTSGLLLTIFLESPNLLLLASFRNVCLKSLLFKLDLISQTAAISSTGKNFANEPSVNGFELYLCTKASHCVDI